MAKVVDFTVKELPRLVVVGRAIKVSKNMAEEDPIPALWGQCFADGTFGTLEQLAEFHWEQDYVGWIGDFSADGFEYICGMLLRPGAPVPEGFACREIRPTKVAVAWVKGQAPEALAEAHDLTLEAAAKNGCEPNPEAGWCLELYNCPRYTDPDEQGDVIIDYYLPVK